MTGTRRRAVLRPGGLGFLVLLAGPLPLAAQGGPDLRSRIDSIATAALEAGPLAGLSLGVLRGDDTLALAGYGMADLENAVPATPRTVYRIGSLTKQFTAAAVMQLVEAGRIDIDQKVGTLLPEFDTHGDDVTVRHLLTHTSGIPSYTTLGDEWLSRIREDLTRGEVLALFEDRPLQFRPGDRYQYSNSGYFLLGMIIERLSSLSYGDYIRRHIAEPLGLEDTHYCSNRTILPRRAEGYSRAGRHLVNDEPISMTQPFAAGGLCSSVVDLLAWQRALREGRVVSPESSRLMTTSVTLNDGTEPGYGFGLGIAELDGHRLIAHGGGINGFTSYMGYLPDESLDIVVLVNTEGGDPWDIARDIVRLVLGTLPPPVADLPLDGETRERYAGYYDLGQLQLRIFERDGRLMAQATGQPAFALLYQGEHDFVASFDPTVQLSFEVRGRLSVGVTLVQGDRTIRGVRVPERQKE